MFCILYLMAVSVVPITAIIECETACEKCIDKDSSFEVLEIYCSMCLECRERGKAQFDEKEAEQEKNYKSMESQTEPQCPTQPPCVGSQECSPQPECQVTTNCVCPDNCEKKLKRIFTTRPTQEQVTTTTTTPRPTTTCGPVTPCKSKRIVSCPPCQQICTPCQQRCPPCPDASAKLLSRKTDDKYAYFGVPKLLWNDLNISK